MDFSFPLIANNNCFDIDHICIYLPNQVKSASILQEFGFHSPSRTISRWEQGTSSRVFFFENAYLEFISIEDENIAKQNATQTGIDIWKRAYWPGASPFGISLRRAQPIRSKIDGQYPDSIASEICVNFATDNLANLKEPLLFIIPDCLALTNWLDLYCPSHQMLMSHPLGVKALTNVKIILNENQNLSHAISLVSQLSNIVIEQGSFQLLELTFDKGSVGNRINLQPKLPIVINY